MIPWWPWGLLSLLAILLLFLYGIFRIAPVMEDQTKSSVARSLKDLGVSNLNVEADGQIVNIAAKETELNKEYIRTLAQATECDTWAGEKICPTTVRVTVEKPKIKTVVKPPVKEVVVEKARFHNFEIIKSPIEIVLKGEVPSQKIRSKIVTDVQDKFTLIEDKIVVSTDSATEQHPIAVDRGLGILEYLDTGQIYWTQGKFAVKGIVTEENEQKIRTLFADSSKALSLGVLDLQVLKDLSQCNKDFAEALNNSSINFKTASATIDSSSESLILQLADIASLCPGELIVEGHTDSVGSEAANQVLSQKRARSVLNALVTSGLESHRISAQGFGESQPIANNDDAMGRAKNRRIVIKINESKIN